MFQSLQFKQGLCCVAVLIWMCSSLVADSFTYRNRENKDVTVEAKLAGSGKLKVTHPKCHALEMANGSINIIPQVLVSKRVPGKDPLSISHDEMAKELKNVFPNRELLIQIDKPYVVAMVLSGDRHDDKTLRLRKSQVKKAGRYFKGIQSKFKKFIRRTRVQAKAIKYPLPVLIFEDDRDFEAYATIATGSKGLSARNIAGFYSSNSNYLNLRIRECKTFETPLHEAIHQQTYNRQIFQRMAPIPVWFVEGIATGFEGDGENIRSGPTTPRLSYAKVSLNARTVDWKEIVLHDKAFRGDIFAGEAYAHAWGLHWLLVTKYKTKYGKYIRMLSAKKTLEQYPEEDRLKDFEEIIGTDINTLQQQFQKAIVAALKKQRK